MSGPIAPCRRGRHDRGEDRPLWYDDHDARSGWTHGTRSRHPCPISSSVLTSIARVRPTEPGVCPAQEVSHHGHTRRYQRLRPDRSAVAQGAHRACPGRGGRGRQRPGRPEDERAPVQARLDVRRLPGRRPCRRRVDHRRRPRDQDPGRARPGRPAVGRPRRRHRPREHRHLHRRREGARRTSTPAPRRSSSAPRPRTRTSRSSSASTKTATTRRPITSSATPAARRTASRRRPRSSTTC